MAYEFTSDAFSGYIPLWQRLFMDLKPCEKLLEIGSYEGRSAVWLIENVLKPQGGGQLYCIDPWSPEWEEAPGLWNMVEQRFDRNVAFATQGSVKTIVHKRKGKSIFQLCKLVAEGHSESFDCVYIDGNHQAAEVLSDIVIAFELVRKGGLIICDDYLWKVSDNPLLGPKVAIDAFSNIFFDKLSIKGESIQQALFIKEYLRSEKEWSRVVMYYVNKVAPWPDTSP